MYINEYGSSSLPKVIILHPMEVTGEEIYHLILPYLNGFYCFIAPDQGGHGKSDPYVSLKNEVETLKTYLFDKGYTDIRLLFGASMGVTVAYELLKDKRFHVDRIWFDGGMLAKHAPVMNRLMQMVFLKAAHLFRKDPNATSDRVELYGEAMAGMMKENMIRLRDEDIRQICTTCCHRDLVKLPAEVQKRMHLEWGETDFALRPSKRSLEKYFPEVETVIRRGYAHCSYMAQNLESYVAQIESYIEM
ncbi:MAG: alpha/beta hydrolase [Clostridiales bacterium]|nr:alpha/beta hydrolase [Clostridiales bacterium]